MATKRRVNKETTKATNTLDFSDTVKAIKSTAKSLNTQAKGVAEEVFDDFKESSEHLKDIAVKPVKEVYDKASHKLSDALTLEAIKKTTKSVNKYTLKTAEELIDDFFVNSEKWQGIASKAIKGGLKLSSKQQAIIFDTLETVKEQLSENTTRFKKLFSSN